MAFGTVVGAGFAYYMRDWVTALQDGSLIVNETFVNSKNIHKHL